MSRVKKTLCHLVAATAVFAIAACKPPQPSAEYLAACEGPPVRTVERREQALQDGYEIDRRYDCISKQSFKAVAEQKAQWEAANTPEAKAARQAEWERKAEEGRERLAAEAKTEADARDERERQWAAAEQAPIEPVEINTASESKLANMPGMDAAVAGQIVAERAKGPFKGWDDVVNRVVGLSAAETALRASAFGLTVNGRSLEGGEPDSPMARFARDKWRRRG
jgi:DNA uptake protein ComE-like DNA-binding protein